MITEEEIQQKADKHATIESPAGKFYNSIKADSYKTGYKQCQQDMLNGNVLIGQMEYNRLMRKAENVKTTDI